VDAVMDVMVAALQEDLFPPRELVFAVVLFAVVLGGVLIAIGERERGIDYLVVALLGGALLGVLAAGFGTASRFLSGLGL